MTASRRAPSRLVPATLLLAGSLVVAGAVAPASAAGPEDRIDIDLSTSGSVANNGADPSILPGWQLPSGQTQDGEVIGGALRLSNGLNHNFGYHAGYVTPSLGIPAGESDKADHNTFDASFRIESATGGYQDGLSITVAVDDLDQSWSRIGGTVFFAHHEDVLKIGSFWIDPDLQPSLPYPAPGLFTWTEQVWGEYAAAASYDIRLITRFVDGPRNDIVDVYVNGELVGSGPSFEGLHESRGDATKAAGTLSFGSGAGSPSVNGLDVLATNATVPALIGGGFLFSDISYRSYDIVPTPSTPPASIDPAPSSTPNGNLTLPPSSDPEKKVTATGSGFDPYENVAFTWYSTPQFAGWGQADAFGNVSRSFTIPAGFAGSTHTLQAVGERSGWIVNASISIAALLPPTGPAGAGVLLMGGLALLLAGGIALTAIRRRASLA